jgi:hypothetical protein
MPTTKPIGPGELFIKAESTPFTFEAFAVTDAIRHLGIPQLGDSVRERVEVDISRGDRGSYHEVLGRYTEPEFTIEIPFFGSGTAGTAVAARTALLESGAGLSETTVGGTSVTYESDEANPAGTVSMYYVDREAVLGQYLIGGIVTSVGFELDKENTPKMVFSGKAARKWEFFKTTLGGALDSNAGTTSMTLADAYSIRTGDETSTSLTGLEIYVKIESEIIKITAFNRTSKVATIVRAQFSTSAAAHDNGSTVSPFAETPTYGEAGLLNGPHDWTFSDGEAFALTKASYTLETGRMFDPLSSGASASSALHNGQMKGTGNVSFILDNTRNDIFQKLDVGTEIDGAFTVGSTAGSIFAINLDHMRLIDGVPKTLESNAVAEVTVNFRTRDIATALAGQLQMVET